MTRIHPAPTKYDVSMGLRSIRLERHNNCWLIWLHANATFTQGSYIVLTDRGQAYQETVFPDGGVEQHELDIKTVHTDAS